MVRLRNRVILIAIKCHIILKGLWAGEHDMDAYGVGRGMGRFGVAGRYVNVGGGSVHAKNFYYAPA